MLYKRTVGYRISPPNFTSIVLALARSVTNTTPVSSTVVINFTAIALQTSYTSVDVPDLIKIVGKTIKIVTDDSTVLLPANWSWDDVTFKIIGIEVAGGENIVILAE